MRYAVRRTGPKEAFVAVAEGELPRKGDELVLFREDRTTCDVWEVVGVRRAWVTETHDPMKGYVHTGELVDVFVTKANVP